MSEFTEFLREHCLLLVLITLFLIFALVGYFVDRKRKKDSPFKIRTDENNMSKEISNMQISSDFNLQDRIKENADIKNKNVN